jgi:hypothetical protein
VDDALDVGLAVAKGLAVSAHVIRASSPWDPAAARTGEKASVAQVSFSSAISGVSVSC